MSLLKKLCSQGSRTDFRALNPNYLIDTERPCYDFVSSFYRQYGNLPTLEALADNGFPMAMVRDNEPAAYYAERLGQRWVVLAARNVINDLQTAVVQGLPDQIRTIITTLAGDIRVVTTGGTVMSLAEAVDLVVEKYEQARMSPGIQGLTFGYDWLDDITGGAQPGDVISMAAKTGMGKSYILNHFMMSTWLSGASVLGVSNEMTGVQMTTRFIGQYTGINPDLIRRGTLSSWTQDAFYAQCDELRHGAPFTIVDGGFGLRMEDLENLVREFNPDLVAVDAAYLMIPREQRFTEKGWERQREMSKDIKRLAMATNKPVIQTVQLSSDAKQKKTSEMNSGMIGGSIGVSQDSTTVLILGEGATPHEHTTRDIFVDKNREGRKSWMRTKFTFDPVDFSYLTCKEAEEAAGIATGTTPGFDT